MSFAPKVAIFEESINGSQYLCNFQLRDPHTVEAEIEQTRNQFTELNKTLTLKIAPGDIVAWNQLTDNWLWDGLTFPDPHVGHTQIALGVHVLEPLLRDDLTVCPKVTSRSGHLTDIQSRGRGY